VGPVENATVAVDDRRVRTGPNGTARVRFDEAGTRRLDVGGGDRTASHTVRVEAGELTIDEILDALQSGRRVVVTTELLGATRGWLRYRLPSRFQRRRHKPLCIGQKQVWFLLRLAAGEHAICLDRCEKPEFDDWCWVDYWYPAEHVVNFKRGVYKRALRQLEPCLDHLPGASNRVVVNGS
jgi:8-oxo-dGTP pyrophosphatase MutT (NUDIX family)